MSQYVDVKGVGLVEFPDGMSQEEMQSALSNEFLEKPSILKSVAGGFLRGVGPTAAFAAAAAPGAEAGLALGPIGSAVGGLITGTIGSILAQKAQSKLADVIAPDSIFGSKEAQAEMQANPWASAAGDVLSGIPSLRFAPGTILRTPSKALVPAGVGTALGVISPLVQGQKPTLEGIAESAAFATLYGEPRFGRGIPTARKELPTHLQSQPQQQEGGSNAQQIIETAQPNVDLLDVVGKGQGPREVPADEGGPGIPPRGQRQGVPAPSAPEANIPPLAPGAPPEPLPVAPSAPPEPSRPLPAEPGPSPPTQVGSPFKATTPVEGHPVSGNYEVVEAGELVSSFDPSYDPALQPRDRTRQASANQIASIVQRFEPQRMGEAPTTDMGAPMVDERGHVLSGNGRTTALRTLYSSDTAGPYKDWLTQNASDFGLKPEAVAAMERPVLVRRVTDYGKLDKLEFTRQSNQHQVLGMGEAEKAASDAKLLAANPALVDLFRPGEDGNVLAASNREFLNAFIKGTGDQAELLSKEGYNAGALSKRVKNAVLGAVVGPENHTLLSRLLEGAEELNLKNVVNGVMANSPGLMRFKGSAYDLSSSLHQALKDLVTIRSTGQKLHDFLTSNELFGDPHRTAESDTILKSLAEARSAKAVSEKLTSYARAASEALQDAQSGGMFGAAATRPQILERIYGASEGSPIEQADIPLGKPPAGAAGRVLPSQSEDPHGSPGVRAEAGAAIGLQAQRQVTGILPALGHTAPPAPGAPAAAPRPVSPVHPLPSNLAHTPAPVRSFFGNSRLAFQKLFSPQNIDPQAKQFSYILRENNARAALDLVRADRHLGELRSYFDKTAVPRDWAYDPNQPLPHNYAVMDALERDRSQLPPELQNWAKAMDEQFAWRIKEVQKLKPGAMRSLIQNYFPHLWENPDSASVQGYLAEVGARSPFHGSKAFMKERTLPTTIAGLARGLKPLSDNPVDMALAKMHQMDKFIMAARTMQEAKANGMLKYYPLGRKIEPGRKVVDDPAFTVYAPPVMEVKEAFDAGIRRGLMDFIQKMGWTHERVRNLGVNTWGQYTTGAGKIESTFGGPDMVIMHEVGHGLNERYGLDRMLRSNDTLKREMADLAALRSEYSPPSAKFSKYIQSPEEQVANAIHGYIYAGERMAQVAPNVQKVIANVIRQHPELQDLNEIKPGFQIGSAKMNVPLAGPVLAGRWTLPEGAAQVLSNHLSPSLSRWKAFRTLQTGSNILSGAQLGLSAFHAGFTSLDAVVSSVATSMAYALRGQMGKAARSAAFSTVAPVANYYLGKAVQAKMIDPAARSVPVMDAKWLGLKGAKWNFSPGTDAMLRQVAELAVKGGLRAETDPMWKTQITRNLLRAVHEGGMANYAKAGLKVPWALVEQSVRPIAEHLVPRQKLGVFAQLAKAEMDRLGPGATNDQVRAGMARAADSTEDRMGQMTYDNLFMNRMVKAAALLGFRAYGWQLGKYRHTFGAAADAAHLAKGLAQRALGKDVPLEVTNRMLYPVALTMTAAIAGGLTNRLLSGQMPQELSDYFFPRNGQNDDRGNPQRLMLPTYLKDLVSDWHDFPNPGKMAESVHHKLNPWVAAIGDMWDNKDFYGVEIHHPDDPMARQLSDLSAYALKQFTPFSLSGSMKLAEEKAPVAQFVLPFFGIVPAKKSLTMTAAETAAADITRSKMPIGSRTRESFEHSKLLRTIVSDLRRAPPQGVQLDPALVAKLRPGDEQQIISMLTLTPMQYQLSRMTPEEAMRVYRLGNPKEQEAMRNQIALKVARSETTDQDKKSAYVKELYNKPNGGK